MNNDEQKKDYIKRVDAYYQRDNYRHLIEQDEPTKVRTISSIPPAPESTQSYADFSYAAHLREKGHFMVGDMCRQCFRDISKIVFKKENCEEILIKGLLE